MKILDFRTVLVLVLGLLTPGQSLAIPIISSTSGSLSHGSSVTIAGSGFGSKSQASPELWDNFEGGTNNQNIVGNAPIVGPAWLDNSVKAEGRPRYSNVSPRHSLSRLSAHHDFMVPSNYNSSLEYIGSHSTVYFTFWWRYDRMGNPYSRNVKPWIEYGSAGTFPMAYTGMGNPDNSDGGIRNSVQDNPMPSAQTIWGGTNIASIEGEWVRFEVYLKQSSPGQSDGTFAYWTHRPYAANPSIRREGQDTTYMTRTAGNVWRKWHFGSYYSSALANVYTDEIYFDVTRARVEIGNAPTWAATTHREIQIPTTWTDTSLTVTLNQGSLNNFDNAYLYVVDATGNVNTNGFPLLFAGNSSPQAPTNLYVQ